MRAMIFGLAILYASAAWANQATDIAVKASRCWSIPFAVEGIPIAVVDVTFDAKGLITSATVVNYTPATDSARRVALSARSALQNCGPYGASGTVRVIMDPKMLFDGSLANDLFK